MEFSARIVVIFSVWVFLTCWTFQAFKRFAKNETSFYSLTHNNAFEWPTINVCPMYWLPRNLSGSFEEALSEIQELKSKYRAVLIPPKVTPESLATNKDILYLHDAEKLWKYSNLTLDDLVTFTVSVITTNENPVICWSLNLQKLNMTKFVTISIDVFDHEPHGFIVMNSEQNKFNPHPAGEDEFFFVRIFDILK